MVRCIKGDGVAKKRMYDRCLDPNANCGYLDRSNQRTITWFSVDPKFPVNDGKSVVQTCYRCRYIASWDKKEKN